MSFSPVVLLSPQRRRPTLGSVLALLGTEGPFALISAGWEEREEEAAELEAHLGQRVTNLRLYGRVDEAFAKDKPLHEAYRERRTKLRETADLYRARLSHAAAAWYDLDRHGVRADLVESERVSAVETLRQLDAHRASRVAEITNEFEAAWKPRERPSLARHVKEVQRGIGQAEAVLVAGGNVAVLLNRLRLFDLGPALRTRPVFAWSAGAMALAEQVVLFHDTPPQGPGHPEVLDAGLGLVRGITPLPHGDTRLKLEERARVALFARRFAPSALTLLDEGTALSWNGRSLTVVAGAPRRLDVSGEVVEAA